LAGVGSQSLTEVKRLFSSASPVPRLKLTHS
jgi:hypothetical protein